MTQQTPVARLVFETFRNPSEGETTARQIAIDHRHPSVHGEIAHHTGYLILQDNSAVIITDHHSLFNWTSHAREHSATWPTSRQTQPWPVFPPPLSPLAELILYRVLEDADNAARDQHNITAPRRDQPAVRPEEARQLAPDLEPAIHTMFNQLLLPDRLMERLDEFAADAADVVISALPHAQRDALADNAAQTLLHPQPDGQVRSG